MAFLALTSAQCDANSPLDETLFQLIRTNFDDHESRIAVSTKFIALGSDFGTTSAAYTNVTAFSFALASGQSYSFAFECMVTNTGTQPIAVSVNGPTTSALTFMTWIPYDYTPVATQYILQEPTYCTAYDTGNSGGNGPAKISHARVFGTLTTTASGTLILRAKSNGVQTITVKKGSYGVLYPY